MNVRPLLVFWLKHGSQLDALEAKPEAAKGKSIAFDLLESGVTLAKKYAPSLNDNGMLDDLMTALKEAFGG